MSVLTGQDLELRLQASANYDDYAFLAPTGNTVQVGGEEVPQFVTLQRDARYRGGEAQIRIDLHHSAAHHVQLEVHGDAVWGETDKMATGQFVVVTNLTDELARNHISPINEISPLPGQGVSVGYKVRF